MSLFQINRYTGDEEDDIINEESRGLSAKKILEKIQQEAEFRRRQKSEKLQCIENKHKNDQTFRKTPKNKRKERKRKHSQNLSTESEDSILDHETTDCLQERLEEDESDNQSKKRKSEKLSKKKSTVGKEGLDNGNVRIKKKKKSFQKLTVSFNVPSKEEENSSSETKDETMTLSEDDNLSLDESDNKLSKSVSSDDSIDEDEKNREEMIDGNQNEIGGYTVIGEVKGKTNKQVRRVLPDWLADPFVITADLKTKTGPVTDIPDLDQQLQEILQKNGITQFFPVQIQVIPMMLESVKTGFLSGKAGYRPSDICVSAPTGSGKTLAFVLPIVQALKSRVTCQVRALVVLPVRDLAIQVFKVFKTYCENSQLKVALLVGQKQFHQEQQTLVKNRSWGYESLADIVVATPGRLVDHINSTNGFSLKQLRFLVIDEADKMMDHIKQDWLTEVENSVYSDERPLPGALTVNRTRQPKIPLQKLLFSATLSQNPDKLQQLNLFQPKLFTSVSKGGNILKPVDLVMSPEKQYTKDTEEKEDGSKKQETKGDFIGKYTTPAGLTEYFVECTAAQKPLIVLHFLHHLNFRHILCFTNSIEATHRLYHLIKLIGGIEVQEFSSGLHTAKRNRILQQFSKGKIDIMICSDAMARGMDIENVKYVISYDPPPFIKTYIHRVGRTARAGKVGTAITMLQKKEFYHFKKMTREAGKIGVKDLKVTKADLQPIVPAFQTALEQLQEVLQAEKMKRKSKG